MALALPPVQAALVGQWRATDYTTGDWISTPATGNKVATVIGTPTKVTAGYKPGTGAIDMLGTSCFTVAQGDNPLTGATAMTLVAIFRPLGTTPSGGGFYQGGGLIGMEQAGVTADWGMSWNGTRVSAAAPNAGVVERTMFGIHQPIGEVTPATLNPIQVAMFTWDSNGTQRIFINGRQVTSLDSGSISPRNAGAFGIGATTGAGDSRLNGEIAEVRLYNSDESANATAIATDLRNTYVADVVLEQARLSPQGGRFVIEDTNTVQVDAAGSFSLSLNGNPVLPAAMQVSKSGGRTTITFNEAILHGQVSYTYDLTVPVVGGGIKSANGTMISHHLPLVLPGPAGSVGSWGIRETLTGDTPLPADVGSIAAAVTTALTNPASVDGSAPVFNHTDPDTNNEGSTGNFNNDLPLLANAAGDQDWIVTGKTQVTVAAPGLYTFSIRSDDGMIMRVSGPGGGRFVSASGDAQLDPGDEQSMFRDGGTGDSNARAIYQFDAAGTYDITYLGWDGGSGGYHEVAWAPGAFQEDRDTNTWRLVGDDSSLPAFRERWAVNPPGPVAESGSFGVRTFLASGANGLGNMTTFLNTTTRTPDNDPANTIDAQEPYLNHRDPNDGAVYRFVDDRAFRGNNNTVGEDNVVTVAKGRISIPSTGAYTFITTSDDGFILRLKGTGGAPDPSFRRVTSGSLDPRFQMSNPNEVYYDGAGQETRAIVDLSAGEYDIEYLTVEGGGGFAYELGIAAGEWPYVTNPPNGFQLVGVPASTILFPAVAAPGWTVESSIPGLNQFANTIAGAEARITHTQGLAINDPIWATLGLDPNNRTTTWAAIDFNDPQDGPQGSFTPTSPWPLNTGNADNDYAVRATGNIIITQAGYYHLGFQGDDGGYMYLYGDVGTGTTDPVIESIVHTNHIQNAVIGVAPGSSVNNAIRVEVGTGNSRTIVRTYLEVGQYQIKTLFWEGGGGSWWEVVGGSESAGYNYPLLSTTAGSATLNSGLTLIAQPTLDPNDPNFAINSIVITGNPVTSVSFNIVTQAGGSYTVQGSANLVDWIDLDTDLPADDDSTPFSVNLADFPALSGQPKVFFRAVFNE